MGLTIYTIQSFGSQGRDSPFFGVLIRDLGNHRTTLACNRALVQEKGNILIE